MRRFLHIKTGIMVGALAGVFVAGPSVLHTIYRLTTPRPVILSNRQEYNILTGEEASLEPATKAASFKKRHALFLWFHSRGLNIDEDDEARSIWHPWRELIDYWRLPAD